MLFETTWESPVGPLRMSCNQEGLTGLQFGEGTSDDSRHPILRDGIQQLQEYFAGTLRDFQLALVWSGTEFQRACWRALTDIPYGQTWSYSQQAAALGRPRAVRAVGLCNGKNPFVIVVPCHRVVGKNGSLTGYGGGLERKRFLLELEAGNSQCQ